MGLLVQIQGGRQAPMVQIEAWQVSDQLGHA